MSEPNDAAPTHLLGIDAYLDRWCRRPAAVEASGPFDVFVEPPPFWPRFSRPRRDVSVSADDVARLVERRHSLGLPQEIEHIDELHPDLADLLSTLGWTIVRAPLLVLDARPDASVLDTVAPDVVLRFVDADDPDLALIDSIGHVAFGAPGMAVGEAGTDALHAHASAHVPSSTRERLRRRDSTLVVALVDGEPVASGVHLADAESSTAEIAGVGTLPAYRRRGLASAVTAALAIDAFDRGIEVVWLSAADVDVAAMYARIGFRRVGTYVISSKP